jgi:hypothetical protein
MKLLILTFLLVAACSGSLAPFPVFVTERPNPHIISGYVAAYSLRNGKCHISLLGQDDPQARADAIREGIEWCAQQL